MTQMFLNGTAMAGQPDHACHQGSTFLGPARTSATVRFFAVRDEFPGLFKVPAGDASSTASSTTSQTKSCTSACCRPSPVSWSSGPSSSSTARPYMRCCSCPLVCRRVTR